MYETVKTANGYAITRMKGTKGFYHVKTAENKEATFKTIKAAAEFCKTLPYKPIKCATAFGMVRTALGYITKEKLIFSLSDESLNRYRTIANRYKTPKDGKMWTTKVTEHTYNVYPIYDWATEDDWIYQGKNPDKPYNELYDYMHLAGLSIHQMRICQPYGDDQRRGLWLFHLIEPETWARVVARVNGANSGAMYINENGNVNGYRKITKPAGHTWKSFATLLINSMPPKTQEHYKNKIYKFVKWWETRGYPDGIPDQADIHLETKKDVPSWRRICKSLLRNDYWCKGLSFTQQKSTAYEKYIAIMKAKREQDESQLTLWGD